MVTNNSMEDFPEVENKQEWYDYRYDGGSLTFQEWLVAGMPTAQEEKTALVWMERFRAWAISILANDPGRQGEIDLLAQDMRERLWGTGFYDGKKGHGERHTVYDLPAEVRNAVNNYWGSLPAAKQKEIDQQAREAQQQAETIARQRGQLPLGVSGTLEQQVQAGYSAIESLKNQLTAAPEYLQDTIRSQIAQLQAAVDRTKEDVRTSYRIRPEEIPSGQGTKETWLNLEEQAEKAKEAYLTPPKVYSGYEYRPEDVREQIKVAKERWMQLKKQADAAKDVWMSSGIHQAESDAEAEQQDEDFRAGTYTPSRHQPKTGYYRATFPYPDEPPVMEWVSYEKEKPSPTEPYIPPAFKELTLSSGQPTWKSWFENKYSSVVSEFFQKPSEQLTEQGWGTFLKNERLRIKEEFMKQSPYQRGERPSAFAPKLRTVNFG